MWQLVVPAATIILLLCVLYSTYQSKELHAHIITFQYVLAQPVVSQLTKNFRC